MYLREKLKGVFELIAIIFLAALNKLGIHKRVSKTAAFVLIKKVEQGQLYFLLVREMFGFRNFSGGRPDEGESDFDAARREVAEETNLIVDIVGHITQGREIIFWGAVELYYIVYEGHVVGGELDPRIQHGKWFSLDEVRDLRLLGDYVWTAIKLVVNEERTTF